MLVVMEEGGELCLRGLNMCFWGVYECCIVMSFVIGVFLELEEMM